MAGEIAHKLAIGPAAHLLHLGRQVVVHDSPQGVLARLLPSPFCDLRGLWVLAKRCLSQYLLCCGPSLLCADRFRRADQHTAGSSMGTILRNPRAADPLTTGANPVPESWQIIAEVDDVGFATRQFECGDGLGGDLHGGLGEALGKREADSQ
jgi:hypothetical protein